MVSDTELIGSDINIGSDFDLSDIDLIDVTTKQEEVLRKHIQCTHGSSQGGFTSDSSQDGSISDTSQGSFTSDAVPHTFKRRKIEDQPSNLRQSTLVFPKLSKEAAAELNKKQFQLSKARHEASLRREVARKEAKAEKKREQGKLRGQKYRALQREKKANEDRCLVSLFSLMLRYIY